MSIQRSVMLLVLAAWAIAACGGDGTTNGEACDADSDCTGGVCFEKNCYTACTDQDMCVADELCVVRMRVGTGVNMCVVAADYEYASCTFPIEGTMVECGDLVPGPCHATACLETGTCGYTDLEDGTRCRSLDEPGYCLAGECEVGCGNGDCASGETCNDCPADCCTPGPCGDHICNAGGGETCEDCPGDCPWWTPVCGDGFCERGEYPWTCDRDCESDNGSCQTTADCPTTCAEGPCIEVACGSWGEGGGCWRRAINEGGACSWKGVDGACREGVCTAGPCNDDGTCDAAVGETCLTCPADCGCPTGQACDADGQCG